MFFNFCKKNTEKGKLFRKIWEFGLIWSKIFAEFA